MINFEKKSIDEQKQEYENWRKNLVFDHKNRYVHQN